MQIIRNESKDFKTGYTLVNQTNDHSGGRIITEGTCLEVLFELLRSRQGMPAAERANVNFLIYECFDFYPDLLADKEVQAILTANTAAAAAAAGILALT